MSSTEDREEPDVVPLAEAVAAAELPGEVDGDTAAPIATSAADSPPASEFLPALVKLQEGVSELRDLLDATQTRLANLEAAMDGTAKQVAFLPPQVRLLAGKVDGLATTISEPRYRAVLLGLLGVYDLVDQVQRTLPPEATSDADALQRRSYEVLRTQLRQILEANGLMEIRADGPFDPQIHRAIELIPVEDPAQADRVVKIVRPGFRTEQSVLRYAEVLVGQFVPATSPVAGGNGRGDDSSPGGPNSATEPESKGG